VGCLRNSQQNFGETSPDYALVTAIEGRALQSEGNDPVPWSGLQTELLERMPGKKCERRAKHQRRHWSCSSPSTRLRAGLGLHSSRLIPRSTQCRSFSSGHE